MNWLEENLEKSYRDLTLNFIYNIDIEIEMRCLNGDLQKKHFISILYERILKIFISNYSFSLAV